MLAFPADFCKSTHTAANWSEQPDGSGCVIFS